MEEEFLCKYNYNLPEKFDGPFLSAFWTGIPWGTQKGPYIA